MVDLEELKGLKDHSSFLMDSPVASTIPADSFGKFVVVITVVGGVAGVGLIN